MEKRRNCSLGAISPLFHNIFNISLYNLGVILHIHSVKGGCSINCFHFCKSDMSKYGYLEVFIESLGFRDNESRLYLSLQKRVKNNLDKSYLPESVSTLLKADDSHKMPNFFLSKITTKNFEMSSAAFISL